MTIRVEGKWSGKKATAVQWNGHNINECCEMVGATLEAVGQVLTVPDDEGVAPLSPGDWLIKPDHHAWLVSCYESMFWQIFKEIDE